MPEAIEPDHLVARLRFRHLRLLTEVQARGSLRAAAQALNLTQPALSKALTEIEHAFGFALFSRGARGLTPTAQGQVVLRGAGLLLRELTHVRAEAAAASRYEASVRIGAPPFVAQVYLPDVVGRLVQGQTPVRVQLLEERVPALIAALRRGELDALVTTFPQQMLAQDAGALQAIKLFAVQFAVMAPAGHALTRARRVGWARLSQEPWVMPGEDSMGRKLIEQCFAQAGLPAPQAVGESSSTTTSIQLVAAGLGIGVVPDVALLQHGAFRAGTVKPVRVMPAPPASAVALICRSGPRNPRVALLERALGL